MNIFNKILKIIFNGNSRADILILDTSLLDNRFRKYELIHFSNGGGQFIDKYNNSSAETISTFNNIIQNDLLIFNISFSSIENIFIQSNIKRLKSFNKKDFGEIECNDTITAFGTYDFAVAIENKNGIISHIWITGNATNNRDTQKIKNVLFDIAKNYQLIAVNWISMRYYSLLSPENSSDFIRQNF